MRKGISIKGVHSYRDLGIEIADRKISIPEINRITETIPYQNGSYDFSSLNGEVTYKNRTLSYTFEIAEESTEKMEIEKQKILNWLSDVTNEKIYDDYIPGYYFIGSIDSYSWEEDFEYGKIVINFSVYPFKYRNIVARKEYDVFGSLNVSLNTDSSHKVMPKIISNSDFIINYNNISLAIGIGTFQDVNFTLAKSNEFIIEGTGKIIFEYTDEVL